jgi:hypothetical protein
MFYFYFQNVVGISKVKVSITKNSVGITKINVDILKNKIKKFSPNTLPYFSTNSKVFKDYIAN